MCAPPQPPPPQVTLAVVNAKVWTGDHARPWVDALAVAGGRIAALGPTEAIQALAAGATVLDARGQLVVPGFIDAHLHLVQGGLRLHSAQLRDARTPADLVTRLRAFAAARVPGTWITGGDWDHENWGGELPHRRWIDARIPDHPVWVTHIDGHMGLANSAALRAASITRETPDVPGGAIVRDADGEPTGLFKDNAMRLVADAVPEVHASQVDAALDAAMTYLVRLGVTSVHHLGSWEDLEALRRARTEGRLTVRVYAGVPLASWSRLAALIDTGEVGGADARGDAWLRVGLVHGFVDGSLAARTAAFDEPYTDDPEQSGLLVAVPAVLDQWITDADRAGLQVALDAEGDRANRLALDIFERVSQKNGPRDRRFRIEHAQHLHPDDVPRFAAGDVIVSAQPYHAIDEGRWVERVIGPARAQTSYAYRSLLDARTRVAFGSDWFAAPPAPLDGIYAAVTRRTLDGSYPRGWIPDQRIAVPEALSAYTASAAYASFQEAEKGRLAVGRLADFAMIDRDLVAAPGEVGIAQVVLTVLGGEVVFDRRRDR